LLIPLNFQIKNFIFNRAHYNSTNEAKFYIKKLKIVLKLITTVLQRETGQLVIYN